MDDRMHPTMTYRRGGLALAVAVLALCPPAGAVGADVNPEPPPFKPTGRLAGYFEKLYSKDQGVAKFAYEDMWHAAKPEDVPMLVRVSRRGRHQERWAAFNALGKFYRKDLSQADFENLEAALLDGTRSGNVRLRRMAAGSAFRAVTHSPTLVGRLIEMLDDQAADAGESVGERAMYVLCQASRTDARVLPAVWPRTRKGDPMRHAALYLMGLLGRIDGRVAPKALPLLATVFADAREDAATRLEAGRGLHLMGARARPAYPVILRVLHKPGTKTLKDAMLVRESCMVLIEQGCRGVGQDKGTPELFADALPDLIRIAENDWPGLKDKAFLDLRLRGGALGCLFAMGPRAKAAAPALRRALGNLPKDDLTRLNTMRNSLDRTLEAIEKN